MTKGVQGIIFSDHTDLEIKQVEILPDLLGCKVYGIKANGLPVNIRAELPGKTAQQLDRFKNKDLKYSGVKWIYGKVESFEKGGITWLNWIPNQNSKEVYIPSPPISKISNTTDTYNIDINYTIKNDISLWFENAEDFEAELYWVEPFLIYPELFSGKKPKGFFIVPIDFPKVYSSQILAKNILQKTEINQALPHTPEIAKKSFFYYGDIVELRIKSLRVPHNHNINIRIYDNDNNTLYVGKTIVNKGKQTTAATPEDYIHDLLMGYSHTSFMLDINNKPEKQKDKDSIIFKVEITYNDPSYSTCSTWEDIKTSIKQTGLNLITKTADISSNTIKILSNKSDIRSSVDNIVENINKNIIPQKKELANQPKIKPLVGYIQVKYEDIKSFIKKREETVNKFVETNTIESKAPGWNSCHYTQINAQRYKDINFKTTEEKAITIFDEKKITSLIKQPVIEVIAGETSSDYAFLEINADLHTHGECRSDIHTDGGKQVFSFFQEIPEKAQNLKVIKIDKDKIQLQFPYTYLKNNISIFTDFPFNYFLLNKKSDVQSSVLKTETCRYKNDIRINVYPDINWEISAKITPTEYSLKDYSHTNMGEGETFTRHQNKANLVGQTANNNETHTWELHLSYTISKNKTDIGVDFKKKISALFDKIKEIKQKLDETSHKSKITENNRNRPAKKIIDKFAPKNLEIPIFMEFSYPSLEITGSWKYDIKDNLIFPSGDVKIGAAPLISAKGGIDLIAAAQYIPIARVVLTALGYIQRGIEWFCSDYGTNEKASSELWFNIYANGNITSQLILFLNHPNPPNSIKNTISLLLGVELGFKIATRTKKVTIKNGEIPTGINAEASGKGEMGFIFQLDIHRNKAILNIGHAGIYLQINGYIEQLKPGNNPKSRDPETYSRTKNLKNFQIIDPNPEYKSYDLLKIFNINRKQ